MTRIEEERIDEMLAEWRKGLRNCWDEDECPDWPTVETHVDALFKELRAQGGVKVASLKWTDESREGDYTLFAARNEVGSFAYGQDIDGLYYHQSSIRSEEHASEEKARAAAENDHLEMVRSQASRLGIVSTLEPIPTVTGEVEAYARFLIDRLDDFERGSLSDDIESACRDFDGHVSPALERLRDALSSESKP